MTMIRHGGHAAEVLVRLNDQGRLEPAAAVLLNAVLFTTQAGGIPFVPVDQGGDPVNVVTDALGGIPEFYRDDEAYPDAPWVERGGGLPRLQLSAMVGLSLEVADSRYVLLEDVGQPNGVASLGGDGKVPGAQLATVAVPVAGEIPRYNGSAQLVSQDPTTDLAVVNRRTAEDMVQALSGIQDANVVAADVVNASATVATVTGLVEPVLDGDVYFISAMLLYNATAAVDFKARVDVPAGSVVVGHGQGYDLTATAVAPVFKRERYTNAITGVANQLTAAYGGIGGSPHVPIYIEARIVCGAAGVIQIQAGQNTEDAGNPVTVYAGSYCLFAKVAPPESP